MHSPSTECWRFVSVPLVRRRRREGVRDNDRAQIFVWGNTTHFRSGAVGATPLVPPEMCGRASSDPCGVAAEHRTAAAILPTSSAMAYVASSFPANQPSWGCKPACKNVPENMTARYLQSDALRQVSLACAKPRNTTPPKVCLLALWLIVSVDRRSCRCCAYGGRVR